MKQALSVASPPRAESRSGAPGMSLERVAPGTPWSRARPLAALRFAASVELSEWPATGTPFGEARSFAAVMELLPATTSASAEQARRFAVSRFDQPVASSEQPAMTIPSA
jgi:hypothetical protein